MSKGTDNFAAKMGKGMKLGMGKKNPANGTMGLGGNMGTGSGGQNLAKLAPGMRPQGTAVPKASGMPSPFTAGFTDMAHLDKAPKPSRRLGFGGTGESGGGKSGRMTKLIGSRDTQPDEL